MTSSEFVIAKFPNEDTWRLFTSEAQEGPSQFFITTFTKENSERLIESEQLNLADALVYCTDNLMLQPKGPEIFSTKKEVYEAGYIAIQQALSAGKISKAVLSKVALNPSKTKAQVIDWYFKLCNQFSNCLCWISSTHQFGTWLGASPEVLLNWKGQNFETYSLAGTRLAQDKKNWGKKERHEQQIVTDYIRNKIAEHAADIELDKITMNYGTIQHILTQVKFQSPVNPFYIADGLHPTPAVAGIPQLAAVSIIKQIESHNRSIYTGTIGRFNLSEGSLFVNLRCAQLFSDATAFYSGGGITSDSECEKEWQETERKIESWGVID